MFQQSPQGGQCFAEWCVKIKKQEKRCVWAWYDTKAATGGTILYQTTNKNLMKKIISEDLSFDEKYGLAMEQGAWNVEQLKEHISCKEEYRVKALEE